MSQQWTSRRQTSSPSSVTLAALPRAQGGTSRVQRARRPPAPRRQLAEAAASPAAIGHEVRSRRQRKLSNQFWGGKERKRGKKNKTKPAKNLHQAARLLFGRGFAQTCSSALKTIHYIDGGVQKYVAVATSSFS